MITIQHLFYEYPGKRALDDVSVVIPEGGITALVGPNGAGKTTLMRCIAALDEPFSGTVQVAGIDVASHPRRVHKELGYLSDFFGLYTQLTIMQCLIFSARLHQMEYSEAIRRAHWAIDVLELGPYRDKKAGTLSRGWRQRLGIAQAIIHKPRLLLLDEPASGLDPEARLSLSALFRKLRDEGMTLLVSSHILAELEDYCTDMLVLRDGKVVEHSAATPGAGRQLIDIQFLDEAAAYAPLLQGMPGVSELAVESRRITLAFGGDAPAQHALLARLMQEGARVHAFSAHRTRLQDVYMALSEKRKTS